MSIPDPSFLISPIPAYRVWCHPPPHSPFSTEQRPSTLIREQNHEKYHFFIFSYTGLFPAESGRAGQLPVSATQKLHNRPGEQEQMSVLSATEMPRTRHVPRWWVQCSCAKNNAHSSVMLRDYPLWLPSLSSCLGGANVLPPGGNQFRQRKRTQASSTKCGEKTSPSRPLKRAGGQGS